MSINTDTSAAVIPTFAVADRMRKARETTGKNQTEFGELVGLSRGTIVRIESGEKEPMPKDYKLYQLATRVPRVWLETGCTPRDLNPEPTDSGTTERPLGRVVTLLTRHVEEKQAA